MKRSLLYIAIIATALVGCRQKGDIYYNPNDPINMAYDTYADQFKAVWLGMNTHYVFWDIDSTNWDAVYKEMLPRFQALDTAYSADGSVPDSLTFINLYADATSTLRDHHMRIDIRDVHTNKLYTYRPGLEEVLQRDYVSGQKYDFETMKAAIDGFLTEGLLTSGKWGTKGTEHNFFGVRNVDDKKIAYLWQSSFAMTETLNYTPDTDEEKQFVANIQDWLNMCLNDPNLLGIILDNRCNNGGAVVDLDLVIAPFINEPLHYADLRYKEGSGRYEYTDWIPAYIDTAAIRRDITAENIPYVVLTNAFSISMAEASAQAVKQLPTGCVIGERTYGAHGQLTSYTTLLHDGSFGDENGKHYVYTSSLQARFTGEDILEGIGITPTKSVLQMEIGYDGAMEKAIDYIKAF